MINLQPISNVVGVLLIVIGFMMLTCVPITFIFQSGDTIPLVISAFITMICGILSWKYKFSEKAENINKRE